VRRYTRVHFARAETESFPSDVDRRISAADHRNARADPRPRARLDCLDERERVPDAGELSAGVADIQVCTEPDCEHARVVLRLERAQRAVRLNRVPEHESDAELREHGRLGGQRIAYLPVRRDREADEAADLAARLVDGDVVTEKRELAGACESGGSGAEDGDTATSRVPACGWADSALERDLGRVALEPPDWDRPTAFVGKDAGALAERLDGADTRAGAAEEILGEDELRGSNRISARDCADEPGDVDVGGARLGAGGRRVRPAALEAGVRVEQRLLLGKRGRELREGLHDRECRVRRPQRHPGWA